MARIMSIMPLSPSGVCTHYGLMNTAHFFRVNGYAGTGENRGIDRLHRRRATRSMLGQQEGPDTLPETLLLIDLRDPQRLQARPNRRWSRLIAKLLASTLDRQLAEGRSPESSRLLATRAQVQVSPVMRRALAANWQNLLLQVRMPPVMRNPRMPLNRECIVACEPEISEMLGALVAPLPASARGMAMANSLLCDGTGPIYNPHRSTELSIAIRDAMEQLVSSVPL
jgi:hypothetical protein